MLFEKRNRSEHGLDPRRVLVVAPQPPAWLIECLINARWNPVKITRIERMRECSPTPPIGVGLVEISESDTEARLLSELATAFDPRVQWIALLSRAHLDRPAVCRNVSRFCYDFCIMPVPASRLLVLLGHAHGMAHMHQSVALAESPSTSSYGILGTSPAIQSVRRSIEIFATRDAPVLIIGETGTGKELTASAIHAQSARRAGPLIAVNCGALPPSLIQSELFGYERGAFTGAERRVIGKLEAANHGTIFLDEIGDLPAPMQVNLLRFLQEHRVQRVGGHEEIELDLRVVAATNVDIERAVQDGRFREDLYYRLNVLFLRLPPLRERIQDIEILAYHVFNTHAHERRLAIRGFSAEALKAMRLHAWPGNVRELINRVRRALIICEQPWIGNAELGLDQAADTAWETLNDARSQAERQAVRRALLVARGNVSEAARRLNITRATVYRMIRKYGLGAYAVEASVTDAGIAPVRAGGGTSDGPRAHPIFHQPR